MDQNNRNNIILLISVLKRNFCSIYFNNCAKDWQIWENKVEDEKVDYGSFTLKQAEINTVLQRNGFVVISLAPFTLNKKNKIKIEKAKSCHKDSPQFFMIIFNYKRKIYTNQNTFSPSVFYFEKIAWI